MLYYFRLLSTNTYPLSPNSFRYCQLASVSMFPFRTNQSRHAEMAIPDVHAHPDKFEGLHLDVSDDVPFMDLNAFYSDDTKLANEGQRPIQLKTEPYTQHSRSCSDSSNSDNSSYIADDRSSIYSVPTPSESLCSESTTLYELAGPDTPSMSCDGDHSDLPPTYNEEIFLLEMPLLPPPSPPIHLNRHCSLHRSAEVVKHWTRRTAHHSSEIPDTEKKTMSATITTIVPFADVVPYPELEPLLKASRSRRTTVPSHARFSFVECRRIPSRTNQEACSRDSPIHISSMLELEDIGNAEGDEHPIPTAELDKKPILGSGNEQDLPNKQLPVAHLGTRRPTTLMIQSRSNTFSHLRARTQLLQLHIPERSPKRIEEVRALIPEPLQLARRLTRAERRHEIEQVPMVRNVELHTNEIERSSRVWAKTRFLSGHKAMQMKMTRSVATSSTVDWAIESGNGSNLLGCIGQSHSSSRRTGESPLYSSRSEMLTSVRRFLRSYWRACVSISKEDRKYACS